jgi:hypothetical protein
MKQLQITLFLLASLVLLTQTVRHIHLYFFELSSNTSAIDPFWPDYQVKKEVTEEPSMTALVAEYGMTQSKINALEKGKNKEQLEELRKEEEYLYQKNSKLRDEIESRERRIREIRDLWIFCFAGIVFIILGAVFYLKQASWTGMSLLIAGFSELIWWSSPSFSGGGANAEYELLLINKTVLSLIGLGLLYVAWYFRARLASKNE